MSNRKRWSLGIIACIGVGVCVAGTVLLLMTGLDRAMPTESSQPVFGQLLLTAEGSMSQGATIGVFLLLSMALIAIALGASAVDRGGATDPAQEPRHTGFREVRAGRILVQRQ